MKSQQKNKRRYLKPYFTIFSPIFKYLSCEIKEAADISKADWERNKGLYVVGFDE